MTKSYIILEYYSILQNIIYIYIYIFFFNFIIYYNIFLQFYPELQNTIPIIFLYYSNIIRYYSI